MLLVLIRFKIHGPALLLSCAPFRHTDYFVVRSHMHKIKSRYAILDQLLSSRVLASIDDRFTILIFYRLTSETIGEVEYVDNRIYRVQFDDRGGIQGELRSELFNLHG